MKVKMKTPSARLCALATVLATGALLNSGCMTGNPDRLHKKVMTWAPVGTPTADATRIMERNGFQCSPPHYSQSSRPGDLPLVECRRTNHVINRIWVVRLSLDKGRVVGSSEGISTDPLRMFNDMH